MSSLTTTDEVYRRIKTELSAAMAEIGFTGQVVSITDEANIDLANGYFVQIRPAGGVGTFARVGQSLVDDQIEVITWIRGDRDVAGRDDLRLAKQDEGVLSRTRLVRTTLQNSTLDGLLVVALRLIRTSAPRKSSKAANFISITDTFACSYEVSTSQLYMAWSATAPTSLTAMAGGVLEGAISVTRSGTDPVYMWCLAPQSIGDLYFWHEGGRGTFFSDQDEPPTGPTCGTVTIGGVIYRRWRSPYASHGRAAVYRVRRS